MEVRILHETLGILAKEPTWFVRDPPPETLVVPRRGRELTFVASPLPGPVRELPTMTLRLIHAGVAVAFYEIAQ